MKELRNRALLNSNENSKLLEREVGARAVGSFGARGVGSFGARGFGSSAVRKFSSHAF